MYTLLVCIIWRPRILLVLCLNCHWRNTVQLKCNCWKGSRNMAPRIAWQLYCLYVVHITHSSTLLPLTHSVSLTHSVTHSSLTHPLTLTHTHTHTLTSLHSCNHPPTHSLVSTDTHTHTWSHLPQFFGYFMLNPGKGRTTSTIENLWMFSSVTYSTSLTCTSSTSCSPSCQNKETLKTTHFLLTHPFTFPYKKGRNHKIKSHH